MPILLAVLVSFLTGVSVPVFTWMVLEKSGTVVERIRGIIQEKFNKSLRNCLEASRTLYIRNKEKEVQIL